MEEWTDSVRIAIDILVACVIITALLTVISLGSTISRTMENNAAAADVVKEYRTANAYEGSTVYPQDIVNLVIVNQGRPAVEVYKTGNTSTTPDLVWNTATMSTQLTSLAVGNAIGLETTYTCQLRYDVDGGINAYVFRQV